MKLVKVLGLSSLVIAMGASSALAASAPVFGDTNCAVGTTCYANVEGSQGGGHDQHVVVSGINPSNSKEYSCSIVNVDGKDPSKLSVINVAESSPNVNVQQYGGSGSDIASLYVFAQNSQGYSQLSFDLHSDRLVTQTNKVAIKCQNYAAG